MAAIHAVRPKPQQSRTVAAHTHPQKQEKKTKNLKNTAAGCGCVCGAADVCPPWPQRKQNKRERNVCSAPQALVARPHVTAPSARRSSRPLLMRAAGEAHRAVVMSVSVGVRVEQLGGKHTAPLTGRVQKKQLKEGRVEKKRNVHIDCPPKAKEEKSDVWSEKKKKHKMNLKKVLKCKQKKKLNLQNNKKPKRGTTSAHTLIAPVKQNTQTERERGRPLNAMETKQKQLRCSAHAARQDGSGACRAKESTNGPAWVCMQYIQWTHYVCASWDEVRTRVHARDTHREGVKDECVCGRCTALSPSLSRGHHRSSSRTRNNKKKQKRGVGVGDRGAAVTVVRNCSCICTISSFFFRGFFAISCGMFTLLVLLLFMLFFFL
ncbi:hypothetical protein ECC02_009364 [Trypanosoma cruzi]|uniref:Uncharacterized protein n=1 Tax=Trypanosoma cruzi TaxID=5693 RepID=A0A7J6XTD4_TRYCR|nr:hypothetical protein ECC02_009364 [Trypanosoma cruzi]